MHREIGYIRGRDRNKNKYSNRKRDRSSDPKYKKQNYNKPLPKIMPFSWNKRCSYSNRVFKQNYGKNDIKTELNNYLTNEY